jgi:SdpC family antimicrobial peptide
MPSHDATAPAGTGDGEQEGRAEDSPGAPSDTVKETYEMKRLIALLLVATTALAGCAVDPAADAPTESSTQLTEYSGQELYTGIFFGQGRAGGLVPSIASYVDSSGTMDAAKLQRMNDLVARIEAVQPGFFSTFAADVQSGDHLVIEAALRRAAQASGEATAALEKTTLDELIASAQPTGTKMKPSLWVDIEVAIFAVVVLVVFAIDATPLHGGVDQELVMDSLTDELAARAAH